MVYQRINKLIPPEKFVERCLFTLHHKIAEDNKLDSSADNETLLSAVLRYDCSKFSCLATLLSHPPNNDSFMKLWNSGHLDNIVASFILQMKAQKITMEISTNTIGERFIALLDEEVSVYCLLTLRYYQLDF